MSKFIANILFLFYLLFTLKVPTCEPKQNNSYMYLKKLGLKANLIMLNSRTLIL